jgi:hypothetical protein
MVLVGSLIFMLSLCLVAVALFYVSLKMLIGPVRMATVVVLQFNLFLLLIDFTYIFLSVVVVSLWCPFSGCLGACLFCDVISLVH